MVASVGLSAVAVVGSEPVATGAAAVDLARAEARHRRVTVVDLIGDAPPLRAIAITDDPHGVADCFEYGVSFGAVTRTTTVHPNVVILPSGSEPIDFAQALPSARWGRLIDEARGEDRLIVFAILSGTPAMGSLTERVDCVVAAPSRLSDVWGADAAAAGAPTPAADVRLRAVERTAGRAAGARRAPPSRPAGKARAAGSAGAPLDGAPRRWLTMGLATAAAVVVVVGVTWLVARRREAGTPIAIARAATSDSTQSRADTLTSTAQLAPPDPAAAPAPVNPDDSAQAAAYAIRVATFPTFADALRALRRGTLRGQAATITPVAPPDMPPGTTAAAGPGGDRWFALLAGAATTRAPLDSLAAQWRRDPLLSASTVVSAPYALRLAADVSADSASRLAAALLGRGVPAYALANPSGTGAVYAGAFDRSDQAAALAASLQAIGLTPVIAYRTGHVP
jgi:hypothetical protein